MFGQFIAWLIIDLSIGDSIIVVLKHNTGEFVTCFIFPPFPSSLSNIKAKIELFVSIRFWLTKILNLANILGTIFI